MDRSTAVISLGLVILSYVLSQRLSATENDEYQTVPRPKNVTNRVAAALECGYRTFIKSGEKPFYIIYWTKKVLILPPKYLNDVRRADREHVDFQPAANDMFFQYRWLEDSIKTEPNQAVIMKGVNPQLPKLSEPLIDEVEFALRRNVGDSTEGKETGAVELCNDLSLRTFSRVLGGKTLARDQKYLDAFNSWSSGNMMTGFITLFIPFHILRHTLSWPLAMYQKYVRQQRLFNAAKGHVLRRLEEEKLGKRDSTEVDALQAAIKLSYKGPSDTPDVDLLAAQLWQLTWAGAQSPTMTLANMLIKILETPTHGEALREEAKAAVDSQGWGDSMLNHMPLMDSFIREVHRLCPILPLNTERKVMKRPFTFSDGLTLPTGTVFAFPSSSCALDNELVPESEIFDPYRFVNLANRDAERQEPDNRWAASQAGATNMSFGYGNHVCPGRFLAVRGLKIIFASLLMDYEVTWKRTGGKGSRMNMEGLSIPDPRQKVTIKRRA